MYLVNEVCDLSILSEASTRLNVIFDMGQRGNENQLMSKTKKVQLR